VILSTPTTTFMVQDIMLSSIKPDAAAVQMPRENSPVASFTFRVDSKTLHTNPQP
jgi:hypothetical protein